MMRKIAIVTGGGTGLGSCLSEELLKKGMEVCIVGRRESKLRDAQAQLQEQYGEKIEYVAGDISDEEFVKSLFLKFAMEGTYVQYLFNCAGTGQFGPAEENNRKMIDIAFDASLIGLILMSSNALKAMKEDGGVIVNIMSTASLQGKPNESVYSAAKWGARGFTEAIKNATKGTKIKPRVALLRPTYARLMMSDNTNFYLHTFKEVFEEVYGTEIDFCEYTFGLDPSSEEILAASDWAFMADYTILCTYNSYQHPQQQPHCPWNQK